MRTLGNIKTCLLLMIVVAATVAPPAAAQTGAVLDYAMQQELKGRLAKLVVQIEVVPEPAQYQDPGLVPARHGQGAPLLIAGRPVIVTSWFLTAGASGIFIQKPGRDGEVRATGTITDLSVARVSDDMVRTTIVSELPEAGLTILAMPGDVAAALTFVPPEPGKLDRPDRNRVFYCVSQVSRGVSVLTDAAVTDTAGAPMERLFLAPGVIPPGTVIFDPDGVPIAIAARESWSGSKFTLVAPLAGALPPKPKDVRPKDDRKVTPGVWMDMSEDREDGNEER